MAQRPPLGHYWTCPLLVPLFPERGPDGIIRGLRHGSRSTNTNLTHHLKSEEKCILFPEQVLVTPSYVTGEPQSMTHGADRWMRTTREERNVAVLSYMICSDSALLLVLPTLH
ncbi:unnamed protein product, partial [Coregonus sp. 'balchen']